MSLDSSHLTSRPQSNLITWPSVPTADPIIASLGPQMVKSLPACNVEDLGLIPGSEGSPGKGMATHSSILAWRIPRIEQPGGLQSMGSWKNQTRLSNEHLDFSRHNAPHLDFLKQSWFFSLFYVLQSHCKCWTNARWTISPREVQDSGSHCSQHFHPEFNT